MKSRRREGATGSELLEETFLGEPAELTRDDVVGKLELLGLAS